MKSIEDYKPLKGFYDLRNYKLPKKKFITLWETQLSLSEMEKNKTYYKKWHPAQWEKAKELSAQYQFLLFMYDLKRN